MQPNNEEAGAPQPGWRERPATPAGPTGPTGPAGGPQRAHARPGDAMIQQLIAGMVELRFQSFLADLPDPMLGVDRRGIIRFVNPQAERLFGRPRADLVGRHADAFLRDPQHGANPSAWHATLTDPELRNMGMTQELAAIRADGSEVPVESTLSLVGTEDGLWVIAAIRDVTERKRAEEAMAAKEEAIRAARDAALEASRLKSQFLATMSHEIRTPMNGVLGLAHLLLETPLDPVQRRYLLALRDSGQSLLEIINDILDFSKVEAGKLELESVDFEVRTLIAGLAEMFASTARDKGLELEVDVSPEVPRITRGDPVRLRQILTNLVGNAVKFTDEGRVRIRVEPGGPDRVRFEVADSGVGIDPAARSHLLDPFTQADASTTRRFGGTGLGLAICRQLIELMGGHLDFESEPGEGSTFWFEVPLPPGGSSRRGVPPVDGEAPGLAFPEAQRGDGAGLGPAPRVLVVDDSGINQMVARNLLRGLGYEVDVADGGIEAVEAARTTRYDLILMDCLMPLMDGFEATAQIRALEGPDRRTPIVAITASAMAGDRERCLEAGMDDYVTKPIAPKVLAAVVSRYRGASPAETVASEHH